MSENEHETEEAAGASEKAPRDGDDRATMFDRCGAVMGGEMRGCPCGAVMRRHPVLIAAILALMGLAFLAVPAAAILGAIAFFRTI